MIIPNNYQIFWLLEMGLPKRKANIYHLRNSDFTLLNKPVFFLSTGRTGTMWFAQLLKKDKRLKVYHSAMPDLAIQCKKIYKYKEALFNEKSDEFSLISEIFLAAREEYFRYAYKCDKRYVETNNQLVFFAPIIAKLLPNSLFVHLYRHPGEFVRSGLRRGWYNKGELMYKKLIQPSNIKQWGNYSNIQKISWLWNETNQFIEDFKKKLPKERYFSFNFNNLSLEKVVELCDFLQVDIPTRYIKRKLIKKENIQKTGAFKPYKNWSEEEKEQLKSFCCTLSSQYGYFL